MEQAYGCPQKNMNWKSGLGIVACCALAAACFMNWAWYPDIQEFFTGFYSKQNYYGRPGLLLTSLAGISGIMYIVRKTWSYRINLILGAITLGYAITAFLRFSSAYDGFLPEKQFGIWLMLFAAGTNLFASVVAAQISSPKPSSGAQPNPPAV
ncbi:MAG: hypothetical protein EAY75_13680 [Bacteroidetes bacterium]|nr:MAG: hypothetical protein EAY75_13680 [Bacteroidota bacterium]